MSQVNRPIETEDNVSQSSWKNLYRIAGMGILVSVLLILVDIALSFMGKDLPAGQVTAPDWFAYLQQNWFLATRNLGFFNVINTTLAIPLFLAMLYLHRKSDPACASLALILCVYSAVVYASNNPALSLLSLSSKYIETSNEAQRALLASTGSVLLAQAEDFTPGAFLGFFFSSLASLLLMWVILRGRIFHRWLALTGLAGTTLLLTFTILATFVPFTFDLVMPLAVFGGLLMLAWNIWIAINMFCLSQAPQLDNHFGKLRKTS